MGEKILRYPPKVALIYVDLSEAYSTCFGWELRLSGFRGKSPFWKLRYTRKGISVVIHSSLISVSISTERRSCVWNVHCVPNIIIEEHRCIGTPVTGETCICWEPKYRQKRVSFVVEGALISGSNTSKYRACVSGTVHGFSRVTSIS
jgi:hypothetical protein